MRVLLFLLPAMFLLASPLAGQTTQETLEYAQERELATFGVRFTAPADWQRRRETSPYMIFKWAVTAGGHDSVILSAELDTARGKTLRGYVSDLAKNGNGEARPETVTLADDPTWRIIFPKKENATEPQPAQMLVALHDQYLYRITAYEAAPGADVAGAIEEMRQAWSFCTVAPPASCLTLRDDALEFLGKFTMKPPAVMRPAPANPVSEGKALECHIFNYRSGRPDMIMTVEADKRPHGQSLEQIGQSLIAQMDFKEDPEKPIKWKKLEGLHPAVICNAFDGARSGPGSGARAVPLRFGLIELNENEVLLLGFIFPGSDKTDREIYEDLGEAMIKTLEVVKK